MHTQISGQSRIIAYGQDDVSLLLKPLQIHDGSLNVNIYTQTDPWYYPATTLGIVNSVVPVIIAPAVAGKRTRITSLQFQTLTLATDTQLVLRNTGSATPLWLFPLPAGGLFRGLSVVFPVPLESNINTSLEILTTVASLGGVFFNGQGFVSA